MTPELKKEISLFVKSAKDAVGSLGNQIALAEYLLSEYEKNPNAKGLPSLPTNTPDGVATLQEQLTIISYLQSAEAMKRLKK